MKEFKFKKTEFSIEIGEDRFVCSYPSNEFVEKFQIDSQKATDNVEKSLKLQKGLFEKMGLPNEAYLRMEGWQVAEITQWLLDFKKK
ncbi:MAG: hypothetical protein V3R57_06210 [Candidatus Bathyarchaeia archaeon]